MKKYTKEELEREVTVALWTAADDYGSCHCDGINSNDCKYSRGDKPGVDCPALKYPYAKIKLKYLLKESDRDGNIYTTDCPFCHAKKRLTIYSKTRSFFCHSCSRDGTLLDLILFCGFFPEGQKTP